MPSWSPEQYLKFAEQRTRPARDLAQRVDLTEPRRIVDLGCGPGNSTEVCAERWPAASILGLDGSAEMIAAARAARPDREWRVADIWKWIRQEDGERFDVVFSNAALQWVADHRELFPRLLDRATPGGVLAAQLPDFHTAAGRAIRETAESAEWRRRLPPGRVETWRAHELSFYYEVLAARAARLDLWATEYLHVLPNFEAVIEWYRGTALRPYLEVLDDEERRRFLEHCAARLRPLFPDSPAGGVLFPFRRLFIIAYSAR